MYKCQPPIPPTEKMRVFACLSSTGGNNRIFRGIKGQNASPFLHGAKVDIIRTPRQRKNCFVPHAPPICDCCRTAFSTNTPQHAQQKQKLTPVKEASLFCLSFRNAVQISRSKTLRVTCRPLARTSSVSILTATAPFSI